MESTNIQVPFCHLANSIVQNFDMDTCQRSEFQVQELLEVSQRDDFAYFVVMLDVDGQFIVSPDFESWFSMMWYTKSGQCMAGRLGRKKFLDGYATWRLVGAGAKPVGENHAVYTSRCQ